MSTPRSREYKGLIEDILDHHDQCREMGLPGLEEDEWQSLGEIVNRAIAKLEKSMATGVPPDMSRHDATSLDLSDKNKDSQLSANPEINPFEE